MRLIVGLGNPGDRYRDTPHNAGFLVCDRLAERHGLGAETKKFRGLLRRGRIGDQDVGVLKPMTYMNLSGECIAEALRYLPAEAEDVVVVVDEIELPQGKVRVRPSGGHGGHNGLRSVIAHLGSKEFPRVRIGVGRPAGRRDPTGHLLSRVQKDERERFAQTIERATDALEVLLANGAQEAMNRYNGLPAIGEEPAGDERGEDDS